MMEQMSESEAREEHMTELQQARADLRAARQARIKEVTGYIGDFEMKETGEHYYDTDPQKTMIYKMLISGEIDGHKIELETWTRSGGLNQPIRMSRFRRKPKEPWMGSP